jgi:MYXO-CTERM domain-containing protein
MRASSLCALSLLAVACAPADQPEENSDRADILDACAPSRIMMILDRSSSMQTGTINGDTKWSIAVDAIDAVTAEFQNNLQMGLMAFPSQGQCSPGETLVQPALGQRQEIADELRDPPPTGGNWTPMAETLAAAQQEPSLQANSGPGDRYALLITDGWQWCDPYDASTRFDAVDRVQELKDMGVTTYVVGFGNSVDARALNLMAVAAGTDKAGCDVSGSAPDAADPCYYQADSPLELQTALQDIVVTITGEICDGLDNNCDGNIDENLTRECGTSCGTGSETCTDGQWSGCDAPPEETEVCDLVDNDCDGTTDPGCECLPGEEQACGSASSVGECRPGVQTCDSSGQWGACEGEVGPENETCDGKDNDCNGIVDDVDAVEICDGVDNNCNGEIDESLVRSCSTACGLGEETCSNGDWVGCDAPPVEPDICDGEDNDCNGTADDDCECIPGETIECGDSDVGECSKGTQTCTSTGDWGACEGDQGEELEICDGKDNDCDGETDESNGSGEINTDDDVGLICPKGDDEPEPPSQSDDPTPPDTPEDDEPRGQVSSGCSTSGSAGGYWLALFALVGLRRRRR